MRAFTTHLARNKTLLGGLVAAIVLALVGTAAAYATSGVEGLARLTAGSAQARSLLTAITGRKP